MGVPPRAAARYLILLAARLRNRTRRRAKTVRGPRAARGLPCCARSVEASARSGVRWLFGLGAGRLGLLASS
eukprot:9031399-Alexandrium_andersonii.AAC.1